MADTNTILSKEKLQEDIIAAMQAVTDFVENCEEEIFIVRKNDKWSIAENLEHLNLSNVSISKLLGMPKEKITARFGSPTHTSRHFSEMKNLYLGGIQKGAVAPPPFVPQNMEEKSKTTLLENWKGINPWLEKGFQEWTDAELDKYQVPHIILGNMTIREILHFTVFHTYHHLKAMKRIVE